MCEERAAHGASGQGAAQSKTDKSNRDPLRIHKRTRVRDEVTRLRRRAFVWVYGIRGVPKRSPETGDGLRIFAGGSI